MVRHYRKQGNTQVNFFIFFLLAFVFLENVLHFNAMKYC